VAGRGGIEHDGVVEVRQQMVEEAAEDGDLLGAGKVQSSSMRWTVSAPYLVRASERTASLYRLVS